MKGKRAHYACSFCGKSQAQARRLIAGPGGVYICDECITLCNQIIEEEDHGAPGRRSWYVAARCVAMRWLHALGSPIRILRGRRRGGWQRRPLARATR